jgi:translation initiation factor IF-1
MSDQKKTETPATTPSTPPPANKSVKEKEGGIEIEGIVREAVKGAFRIEIPAKSADGKPHFVLAHLAGKLRKNFIKIVPGDRVKVEVSPYDINRGRITFRLK